MGTLFLVFMIFYISIIGIEALSDPELLKERMQELQNN